MWGEHGGEWWAQNGLIDFRSAMGSLFLKDLFYRAGLLGKVGWRGRLAVMWGEHGGECWC
ncbi:MULTISPECIES: hypothetical protein [unclassified Bartonella]|uniref:hypothetical protein n=1 Tax=unclassified Bartonella TaxID=2645622 RepID=UPI0035CFFFE9